ncbi:MAG: N-acetyl-gamma-glutamyl-phosphate reductase [Armatimonadota bacterium]|nr:MAG: N-acetyl-gamma-glutamyl-phosphate reductase [Armatimonadota bacterium]
MIRVGIAGATGYGGVELVRLLKQHPQVELAYLTSETYSGKRMDEVYPHLHGVTVELHGLDPDRLAHESEVAFLALPSGQAMELVPPLLAKGKRVIDLSADHRLRDAAAYPRWYGVEHPHPELLVEAVYGLPELHRAAMREARLVAAPGCYPSGAILAMAPLVSAGLVNADKLIVDSKSGVSGAGRTALELAYHYPEANEDVSAYKVASHRHTPEMEQELSAIAGSPVTVTFSPHLVPMTRGIATAAYAPLCRPAAAGELIEEMRRFYAREPFIQVLDEKTYPHTKHTAGWNLCQVTARVDERTGIAITLSALDNLGKGLSGACVQCFNIMCGFEEATAISEPGPYP